MYQCYLYAILLHIITGINVSYQTIILVYIRIHTLLRVQKEKLNKGRIILSFWLSEINEQQWNWTNPNAGASFKCSSSNCVLCSFYLTKTNQKAGLKVGLDGIFITRSLAMSIIKCKKIIFYLLKSTKVIIKL